MNDLTAKPLKMAADMAKCDKGYICEVCNEPVKSITDSHLYLRYVIGEIDSRALLSVPERHIRCDPDLAQFIVDEKFEPVISDGPFDKRQLDREHVQQREELVTAGWHRLREVVKQRIPINEYPLPEFQSQHTTIPSKQDSI